MAFAGKPGGKRTTLPFAVTRFLGSSALGTIGLLALSFAGLLLHLNLSTAGLLYLLAIVLVALQWGFALAAFLSVVAVLCQCYFFMAPIYSFYIEDPQNYVALFVFECSALLVSLLSARARTHARDAQTQRRNMAMLYELSQRSLQVDLHQPPGPQLVRLVTEVFEVNALAIFDSELDSIDVFGSFPSDVKEMARNTCYFGMNQDHDDLDLSRRVLRFGTAPVGALLVRGSLNPLTVDAIASLIGITFEHYRSFNGEIKPAAFTPAKP